MDLYWVPIGFGVVVVLLVVLLARMVGNSKRREIRKKLGLPEGSRLTPEQAAAFQAFENTDLKLKKSFPTMSDTQRQSMAREVLRDKGMLPKNPLGRAMYRKLKVYKGSEHPHAAQQPQPLDF